MNKAGNALGWIGTLFLLSLCGCGKDKDAVPARDLAPDRQVTQTQGKSQNEPSSAPSPSPASAEQLFAAQYERVELVCSSFAYDTQELAPDATPTSVFSQQVYPEVGGQLRQTIQSASGRLSATFSIETSLSATTVGQGGTVLQVPVVMASSTAYVHFNGAEGTQGFPTATLRLDQPAVDRQVASASWGSSTGGTSTPIYGGLLIRCHLEGKPRG